MGFLRRWVDSFKPAVAEYGSDPWYAAGDACTTAPGEVKEKGPSLGNDEYSNAAVAVKTEDDGIAFMPEKTALKRSLGGRHIQFIALGGSIGTGLFIGSGETLRTGGPAFLIVDFLIVAVMLIAVVFALGELASVLPVTGAFSTYATRFIDPSWGFAMGWNYWLQWIVALPLEATAATIIIQYWDKGVTDEQGMLIPGSLAVPEGVWIAIFLVIMIAINLFGVRGYGEFEFAASLIKVLGCIGFIIAAIVIDVGGTPARHYFGAHTWHDPGPINNGFKGFCSVFTTAAFAFSGTELIGLAAAETSDPRRQMPRACKQVIFRVLLFYILSLFLISLIVPSNTPALSGSSNDPRASPFVIALKIGGINALPSIFNAVILISALSVGNASVYGSSRTLLALAEQGHAPKIFGYIDRTGRPLPSLLVSLAFGLLGFLIYSSSQSTVFAGSYVGFVLTALVIIASFYVSAFPIGEGDMTSGDRADSFFLGMLSLVIVVVFFFVHKAYSRSRYVRVSDIDIHTGRRDPVSEETLEQERAEERAKPLWYKFLTFLF
ncbi:hypothetical protein MSPP1_000835 [Malassezia sp. CBS 17886]|nr:hypothetical protein MSPP1_000835 [Malassezia sp. CBS 17886]